MLVVRAEVEKTDEAKEEEVQSGVKSSEEGSIEISKEESDYLKVWANELLPLIKTVKY